MGEWLRVFACPYRFTFVVVFAVDLSVRRLALSLAPLPIDRLSVCLAFDCAFSPSNWIIKIDF